MFVVSDNDETSDTDHVTDEEHDKPPSTPAFEVVTNIQAHSSCQEHSSYRDLVMKIFV